ncbi:MAG: phosphoribosyltransferase family protein [Actinomycetota bacterium]
MQLNPVEEPLDLDQARRTLTSRFPLVNDHPDVAGVLRDGELLALTGRALAEPFRGRDIDHVIAPEARGPILGALVARELGAGLVLARKDDRNHPGADIPVRSEPTWRGHPEVFQGRSFDLSPGERVVIVDDWITTGSTLKAARSIVQVLGGEYAGAAVLMNKAAPTTIDALDVHWLVDFEELVPHG